MRRTLFTVLLLGLLIAVIPAGSATAAGDACGEDFPAQLNCWTAVLGDGADITVTLNKSLAFDTGQHVSQAAVRRDLKNLRVQVPAGIHTGQGGTALFILAGHRLVDRDARIDRLDTKTLNALGGCGDDDVCNALKKSSQTGRQLIDKQGVAELGAHKSTGYLRPLVYALTAALLLLLLALFLAVRRTRAPVVVAAVGEVRSEETTARLRPVPPAPAPPPSPGRRVGPRTGPSRTAVVRTALHPQGYVELDHVLYRAVWAEPDRTPPEPGAQVEVTDAREPDSDVLYAFPPAARHHARGSS
ncbi:hypothetical protein SAMN05216489_06433 [Streptomyces sp. 3213]|uniref:hypothetical protein n=1 Tax=Streptomyces sp. 3213.3 TaxID=1855348 RepID=UPI000894EF6D|nr:hypothetical protein [Streptomyces sp. 3213.3]SEE38865.1 hypothetical protein SAMN05216489_06433 [Streptomyces sp. 3213] [Streptomyces sp. 3213.3]